MAIAEAIQVEALGPVLKWAGGKRWLAPWIKQAWLDCGSTRLVEPFVGAMAIALSLCPKQALLNDINPHLMNLYDWMQGGLSSKAVALTLENTSESYYAARDRFNFLIKEGDGFTPEAAWLFYYLNRTDFNGLCRFNKKGYFNAPYGRYKHINYASNFYAYVPLLQGWELSVKDFAALVVKPTDFIYADPPYPKGFVGYAAEGFNWGDQVRLAEWLAQHEGPVVVSNLAIEPVIDLYTKLGFEIQTVEAPRRISCKGDRTPVLEMVASRNCQVSKIEETWLRRRGL